MQLQLSKHIFCRIILSEKGIRNMQKWFQFIFSAIIWKVRSLALLWASHMEITMGKLLMVSVSRAHILGMSVASILSSWCELPLGVDCIVYDVVEVYSPLVLAAQQSKSGFRQKPRRPSCPDEPKMGVGWAKWISSPLQSSKGTWLLPFQMPNREQSQLQSIALAALWFWIWSMRKKGQLPDDKRTQPDLS